MNLSVASVRKTQKELLKYRNDLQAKCEKLVQALANKGILVAEQNVGEYGKYILFEVQTEPEKLGAKALLIASNTGLIRSEWRTQDGVREADVSPLLMAEFGSGLRANNSEAADRLGMGTGTFPEQTHAEDPSGWWYMDLSGEWHHSYGIRPSMPMTMALSEIIDQISDTAREVFGK